MATPKCCVRVYLSFCYLALVIVSVLGFFSEYGLIVKILWISVPCVMIFVLGFVMLCSYHHTIEIPAYFCVFQRTSLQLPKISYPLSVIIPNVATHQYGMHLGEILLYTYCFFAIEFDNLLIVCLSFAFGATLSLLKVYCPFQLMEFTGKKSSIFVGVAVLQNLATGHFIRFGAVLFPAIVSIICWKDDHQNLHLMLETEYPIARGEDDVIEGQSLIAGSETELVPRRARPDIHQML